MPSKTIRDAKKLLDQYEVDKKEVDGPTSSTNGGNAVFDGTTGRKVKELTPATHIADPTGAVTDQDDEARAAIASILNALEAAKIVAAA